MFCEVQTFWIELVLFAVWGWDFCMAFHGFVVSLGHRLTSYCLACHRVLSIHQTHMLCGFLHPWSRWRQSGPRVASLWEQSLRCQAICPVSQGQDRSEKWAKAWPDPIVSPGYMALSFGSRLSLMWHRLEDSSCKFLPFWVTHRLPKSLLWVCALVTLSDDKSFECWDMQISLETRAE